MAHLTTAQLRALNDSTIKAIESDDPPALVGLPLIRTCALLRLAGVAVAQRQRVHQGAFARRGVSRQA